MKISYKWLKDYIDFDLSPEEVSRILTDTGLEVEGLEEVESIKGGLKGVVIGKVLTCKPHENSDHLSVTTVDLGNGDTKQIVCGAPNVAEGQTVPVATVGSTLYDGDEEFKIKKSKIRGEESYGMICAEDEIGVGDSHEGIMVLPDDAKVGMPASEYFNVESDYVFEIGLTPNRIDGASHIGTARDLAAFLNLEKPTQYKKPAVDAFKSDRTDNPIKLTIEDTEGCYRYSATTVEGITVKDSPEWLKNRLKAIGLSPINNVVDITNFVLHETGQPLHAFDADKIKGDHVIVKTLPEGTKFKTLDEEVRTLTSRDLMICNAEEGMTLAGIFGGIDSGVTDKTTRVFLESAWFNPVRVRKSARYHGLNTDSSFRFERGTDPNGTIYALKRAALLIKELAGGEITSDIIDEYPKKAQPFDVKFSLKRFQTLAGKQIDRELILKILKSLEIEVANEQGDTLDLKVPPYRVDVQREADVTEEILRIYGYNNIEIGDRVHASLSYQPKPDEEALRNRISDMLTASAFNEAMSNSITKAEYFEAFDTFNAEESVMLLNPLSNDLNAMRQTLLFSAMEAVEYNANRQNADLKLYEFGKVYSKRQTDSDNPLKAYAERTQLALVLTGNKQDDTWSVSQEPTSFYELKAHAENVMKRMGVDVDQIEQEFLSNDICREGLVYKYNNKEIARLMIVSKQVKNFFDLKADVYFAQLEWEYLVKLFGKVKTQFTEVSKFPAVRRDMALLLDKSVTFDELKQSALKAEKKLIKQVGLFDVYEGENIEEGKKSYALSFIIQDETKTLKDKQIDKLMNKLKGTFEHKFGAQLR
ncbi:MAG TPA: phenylalanine--tRNA ligase subunit beta [Salinivirga sp.]|uniref:phenylalanine--tRNA ligase subunit beta n=1 Tax=Salinivirga sp. TaxID=1970192 RepID=UPI002B477559|nr:phenylalanine--tRNA ligase subunit beta [Salinivirga sp.]HKK58529.1 phenylalanine--tRNA ligase subunit beta [Salinivirga sp.]